jgi:hypothetical protein
MGLAEADEAGALGVARDCALQADGTKRVGGAFGRADNVENSSGNGPRPRTLEEPPSREKPFPQLSNGAALCASGGEATTLKMGWCDEVLGLSDASGGEVDPPPAAEEVEARLASLPMADLVRAWREVNTTGLKDQTAGTHAFFMYFDSLAHETPDRAVEFIEAELTGEPDDEIVMLLAESKVLSQLLHFHGLRVSTALQALALRQPRLRWLMGRLARSIAGGMVETSEAKRRLLAISDEAAYRAWEKRMRPQSEPIDFAALPMRERAAAWVEITARSDLDKQRDDNIGALFDYQSELITSDPLEALELVKTILEIEDNQNVLGLLAAGLLEDLIPEQDGPVIDAVVAEAGRNPRFRTLLGGVWFYGMSPEVTARLQEARGEVQW